MLIRYSLCVPLLTDKLFSFADERDSVGCVLLVHGIMGIGNGYNDCTSEGCKLGKARLRTKWPCGIMGQKKTGEKTHFGWISN